MIETFCSLPVATGSIQSVWLALMGLTGLPGEYFLQQTSNEVKVWLISEGTAAAVFTSSPGFEVPKVSATLSGSLIDTTTIVVNR